MGAVRQLWWQDMARHRAIFVLAIPMVLSNITTPLLGMVDSWVIGHLSHAWFLGGVSVGSSLINALFWLLGFLRMSTTGLTAQAYGLGDPHMQAATLLRASLLAWLLGLLLPLLLWPWLDLGLALTGASAQVQHYAGEYLQIRLWSAPAVLMNLVMMGWLLGMQNAKGPMLMLIFTNLINIALDWLLVLGLGWQVQGVAWASLIADYSTVLLGAKLVARQWPAMLPAAWRYGRQVFGSFAAFRRLISLNRDIFLRSLCLQLCFVFMSLQGARLGDVVVAANAVLLNFLMLLAYGLDGFAYAVEAMVGRAIGQRDQRALIQAIALNLFWALLLAGVFALLFGCFGEVLIGFISAIPAVVAQASELLPWLVAMPLVAVWCFVFDGAFIGATRAREMRNSMFLAVFAGFFPVYWLCQSAGAQALWAAMSTLMLIRGASLGWLGWRLLSSGRLVSAPH